MTKILFFRNIARVFDVSTLVVIVVGNMSGELVELLEFLKPQSRVDLKCVALSNVLGE